MNEIGKRLPVRKDARDQFGIDEMVSQPDGEVVLADLSSARELAHRMNRNRDLAKYPDKAARASELNAMGLIDEIQHHVIHQYRKENGLALSSEAWRHLTELVGADDLETCVRAFVTAWPPGPVHTGELSVDEYLDSTQETRTGREIAAEQLLTLALRNGNPACSTYAELFADGDLAAKTAYTRAVTALNEFFAGKPSFGPDDEPLVDMLGKPARLFPDSLYQQLSYIQERWGAMLGDYLYRLLRGLDYLREEQKVSFVGPGPAEIYTYSTLDSERFSPDRDWMPNVVMIAKSTLVWLDQLSKAHEREITRLDQIPESELDKLASYGINALWLIGLWQRSHASRRIKHIGGNPEAEASAYALYDYEIASELGGWDALSVLRDQCKQRGIRLASDMVPNHTGIDGRWVIEHPDWFVQLDHSPFPAYSFNGEDLSQTAGITIQLEDHYYDKSDAAVVFERRDHNSGETRFIYHGNDGTSMPWNDTAQLNFLNAETREAVVQTILHVARNFPIIRFDAAMTLAKKHIRRLWFPEPGAGGDIASRAEHGLTEAQFNELIPQEFWREVVDRVAAEVPDTLLLAEAFWMMEGYFVRTLGMHRVYNSAFMNMLKNEENKKYRQTIKNTIEFDKDILKRFVNFMNNPDEETAVTQFGTGDKYFGVCTVMMTMPGLPMIGHGQIEGLSEKYGMEFRRAYRDEKPDQGLIARHGREIFPLIRHRYLFSSVENFLLYDLYSDDGSVNEDVFVYSNQVGPERSLVLFNNCYERAWGWVRTSAGYVEKVNGTKEHRRRDLADAMGLHHEHGFYCLFQDIRDGLWYIRKSVELHERGMFVTLDGYQSQVFLNIHEVRDNEFLHYAKLGDELAGRGVPDLTEALRDVALRPLLDTFSVVANSSTFDELSRAMTGDLEDLNTGRILRDYGRFLRLAEEFRPAREDHLLAIEDIETLLGAISRMSFLDLDRRGGDVALYRKAVSAFWKPVPARPEIRDLLAAWLVIAPLGCVYQSAAGICEEWNLTNRVERAFQSDERSPEWRVLIRILLTHRGWWRTCSTAGELLSEVIHDSDVTSYLGFNEYEDVVWFNQERYHELAWWFFALGVVDQCADTTESDGGCLEILDLYAIYDDMLTAEKNSEFQVARLLEAAQADAERE